MCTPWWYYPLAIFSPQDASIVTEAYVTALVLYIAHVLNATHDSLSLLNEEVYQLRKVALQNHMALNILTATQGGVCALVEAECCVYIPNVCHNVSQALRAFASETRAIEYRTDDPLHEWQATLTTEWQWVLAVLGNNIYGLVACCCSLYCCCGIWIQGSALLTKGPLRKTPLCRLYVEEP